MSKKVYSNTNNTTNNVKLRSCKDHINPCIYHICFRQWKKKFAEIQPDEFFSTRVCTGNLTSLKWHQFTFKKLAAKIKKRENEKFIFTNVIHTLQSKLC